MVFSLYHKLLQMELVGLMGLKSLELESSKMSKEINVQDWLVDQKAMWTPKLITVTYVHYGVIPHQGSLQRYTRQP